MHEMILVFVLFAWVIPVFGLFVVNLLLFAPFPENVLVDALLVVVAKQPVAKILELVLVFVLFAEEIPVFELFVVNFPFSEHLLIVVLVLFA